MIDTSQKSKISDATPRRRKTQGNAHQDSDHCRFKDYQDVTIKQNSILSPTHSLCINCADYYDVPPCQTSLNNNGSCFPSLISPDRN